MRIPAQFEGRVRTFVQDFAFVTGTWVRDGWHSQAEVEAMRATIREDMQSASGVDPAIDPRPQGERIVAWCRTFGELAMKMKGGGQ